ncbi:glycosyltransferase [Ideonella paludis]|uniref:Glycosyltransferase n=1 Tax=Ideonella paludis TaxID=1233411 RepID=A0ABS5DWU2_9BURK|nr:glycosyltransferase [Ideonella paludis]MBQ0935617.1 glycosyltransferase [Ideonella paludis]
MRKIHLVKSEGPVVFIGGMNAMPMMYAIELRKVGIDVIYIVDRPKSDGLSRPENHFEDIPYPYPDWIIESVLPSQILVAIFPRLVFWWISRKIKSRTTKSPQAWVLNGFFCSMAFLIPKNKPKVFLSHGSDLDCWADVELSEKLASSFQNRSFFKFLPSKISTFLIKRIVARQLSGALSCDKVIYFPKGFNSFGDRVVSKLVDSGVGYIPRYDVSFDALKNEPRGIPDRGSVLRIFSGVRFLFATFPEGNEGYGKGNDVIIEGLAKYFKRNRDIEIHFVEKGEDVLLAKKMCKDLGIEDVVIWHKEMRFIDLLSLYRTSDVCFDQVGAHWIGAIGVYALWLGKPLIANDYHPKVVGLWDHGSPILSASTADEIFGHLVSLESVSESKVISSRSMEFAENVLGPQAVMDRLFEVSA